MSQDELLAKIVEVNQRILDDTATLKDLKQELIDTGFETGTCEGFLVYTTTRMTPVLKEGITDVDIIMDFPDVIKIIPEQIIPESKTIDMKLLLQLPSAQKILDIQTSTSITVKKDTKKK